MKSYTVLQRRGAAAAVSEGINNYTQIDAVCTRDSMGFDGCPSRCGVGIVCFEKLFEMTTRRMFECFVNVTIENGELVFVGCEE